MATKKTNNSFAILGLGRFGMSIVKTLSEYDVDILACDIDETALHSAMEYATHVVQADKMCIRDRHKPFPARPAAE